MTSLFPEPNATAWLLVGAGVLLLASVLMSRVSARFGVPLFFVFLVTGMLGGSEAIGGVAFEDYALGFRLGTLALVLILFDGGLNTPLAAVRRGWKPATLLATVGVMLTAAGVALTVHYLLGIAWPYALLLGAVVSSTDAAAVFSVLRSSGLQLKQRVGTTLELESGLNDPMAVILTTALTVSLVSEDPPGWWLLGQLPLQLGLGVGLGVAAGYAGRALLQRLRVPAGGLYAVLALALAAIAFAAPTLVGGSGFLAVYVAGLVIGNSSFPYRSGLLRFHDALAWVSQVSMFLMLGLLVFPSELLPIAGYGVAAGLLLSFVVRPLAVALCLVPMKTPLHETAFIGWVGLRGAVPIVLATFPVMAGVEGARSLFNLVFWIVVVSAVLPGATVGWVTRRLGMSSTAPPPPPAMLEITSVQPLGGDIMTFHVSETVAVCGVPLRDLPLPEGALVMLLLRGNELLAPRGSTVLAPGDRVYVFAREGDRPLVELLFGAGD